MSYEYEKNSWDSYDESVDISKQPDAIITKKKLDRMEAGIERASMSIEIGNITTDNDNASASITVDEFSIAFSAYSNWYILPSWDKVVQTVSYDVAIFNFYILKV